MELSQIRESSNLQNNPINKVKEFVLEQYKLRDAKLVENYRLIGGVLRIDYNSATITTNDTYKMTVGGIPRGSFLIMVPSKFEKQTPHFALLRVKDAATTPLDKQVQETFFEMHKKSMPELDVFTQADLQWGALECDILGMYYANPKKNDELMFSGDQQ